MPKAKEPKCGVKAFSGEKFHKSTIERSTDKTFRELEARWAAEEARRKAAMEDKYTVKGVIISSVNRSDGYAVDFIRIGDRPALVRRVRKRSS